MGTDQSLHHSHATAGASPHRIMLTPCNTQCGTVDGIKDNGMGFDDHAYHSYSDPVNGVGPQGNATALGYAPTANELLFKTPALKPGKYQVCFCDADRQESNRGVCSEKSDYTIRIGDVHVGGVSCLLTAAAKYQKHDCM